MSERDLLLLSLGAWVGVGLVLGGIWLNRWQQEI